MKRTDNQRFNQIIMLNIRLEKIKYVSKKATIYARTVANDNNNKNPTRTIFNKMFFNDIRARKYISSA